MVPGFCRSARVLGDIQVIQRQVVLLGHPGLEPAPNRTKLAMTAAIALQPGSKRSSLPLQLDHVIDELDRYTELCSSRTVAVTFFDEIDNALAEFNRMCLARVGPPISASCTGNHNSGKLKTPNPTYGSTL